MLARYTGVRYWFSLVTNGHVYHRLRIQMQTHTRERPGDLFSDFGENIISVMVSIEMRLFSEIFSFNFSEIFSLNFCFMMVQVVHRRLTIGPK
jgi:hypothetical protein